MYFRTYPHVTNFEFVRDVKIEADGKGRRTGSAIVADFIPDKPDKKQCIDIAVDAFEGDIYRLAFTSQRWPANYSQAGLCIPPARTVDDGRTALTVGSRLDLTLADEKGRVLLQSIPQAAFGVCGQSSCFVFKHSPKHQYYGMGEKLLGLELTGVNTKFWNTDVWGDFKGSIVLEGKIDPSYLSIPYVIVKQGNTYLGLLLDNPYATYMQTGAKVNIAGQMHAKEQQDPQLILGAEHGQPNLWILYGPSLAELTRKLQTLVGRTFLPPVWALGYHQCRWGYQSQRDLEDLDSNFRKANIPVDGLWLDIEYMDGYRVFTFDKKNFRDPAKAFRSLLERGRRVVPIIDPGVKREPGYSVYESGRKADAFCRNPQGQEFVGLVWPGETVFPDFSIGQTRDWWSGLVKAFASLGLYGCWLDMNDPSTGRSRVTDMLFDHGRRSHYTYHNQYALGMAMASRAGFEQAHPDLRPFLLTRSGYTGISRYSAVWTGDNYSNYHYLKKSIPTSLNLALSGVPFNGPDIAGFGGDTTPALAAAWMKACFLFPFCRNHTAHSTAQQEPWALGRDAQRVFKHYIQLRYRLRPYLYDLFVAQNETGEAILRPLFYDFGDTKQLPLGQIDDQFLIGPSLMQAPMLEEGQARRRVVLPGKQAWYSLHEAKWLKSGRIVTTSTEPMQTPLYAREGALFPVSRAKDGDNVWQPEKVEVHVFLRRTTTGEHVWVHTVDDGTTRGWEKGERSRLRLTARVRGGVLHLGVDYLADGYGPVDVRFVLYDNFKQVQIDDPRGRGQETVAPKADQWTWAGTKQAVWRV